MKIAPLVVSRAAWYSSKIPMLRPIRRLLYIARIFEAFFAVAFTRQGLGSAAGRQLIWGKLRRSFITQFPAWARALQKKHGLQGGCISCGASCKLLFQCPHWNESSHLCNIYEDRPNACRFFPMTPSDISDRNLVLKEKACGFRFDRP